MLKRCVKCTIPPQQGSKGLLRCPKYFIRTSFFFLIFDFSVFHFKVALFRVVLHFRGGVGYKMVKKFESKLLAKKLRSQ